MTIISGNQLIGYVQSGISNNKFTSTVKNDAGDLYLFREATDAEINEAITKANQAGPLYKKVSYAKRAEFLERIADEILAVRSLITITALESGLTETRLLGERTRTINQLLFFAKILREGSWVKAIIDLPSENEPGKADLRQMQVPLGVTGVFGASNFPYAFSVAGGDTVSALAAGCPVVHKAHPAHPVTAELVGRCIVKAAKATDMPEGVFSLLHGTSYECSLKLVRHPLVKAIAFTGSYQGGKALFAEAVKREEPIPVYAEMGSINPVFILPGILEERGAEIARLLAASNLLGAGQFCTNPGIVVLPESVPGGRFIDDLKTIIADAPADMMLTENIYKQYNNGINVLKMRENVELLAKSAHSDTGKRAVPHVFHAKTDTFLQDSLLKEEVFGPNCILISTQSKNEVLDIANHLKGQLTATVWGNADDLKTYSDLLFILQDKAGRVIINAMPTGVEVANAMVHGGPFPATTNSSTTSVGATAIYRFTRPVCFQGFPDSGLPAPLQNSNPLGILRQVDGEYTKELIVRVS